MTKGRKSSLERGHCWRSQQWKELQYDNNGTNYTWKKPKQSGATWEEFTKPQWKRFSKNLFFLLVYHLLVYSLFFSFVSFLNKLHFHSCCFEYSFQKKEYYAYLNLEYIMHIATICLFFGKNQSFITKWGHCNF